MIDQTPIRQVLLNLNPAVSHKAAESPSIDEIYTPPRHADALAPDRPLVVGGRGVGKSFWASVLRNEESRNTAARAYPKLGLERFKVELGFHEGALGTEGVAPSPATLKIALQVADDPASIWRSVLIKAIDPELGPRILRDRVQWIESDPEAYEDALLSDDKNRAANNRPLLLIFDALDVMANDWETIRKLTHGLLRVALEMTSRRAIFLKLFIRRDQFADIRRNTFADFSKLSTAAVELEWAPSDLYGLLFSRLWRDSRSHDTMKKLGELIGISMLGEELPRALQTEEKLQERLFASFAGEFMGSSKKRGRTYTWLPKHLADAHEETSLRSFLIALKVAAERAKDGQELAIDRQGINAGVLDASETRREELKEDNPWVEDALDALSGLIVPCDESEILTRWRSSKTFEKINARTDQRRPVAPIQLDFLENPSKEHALLSALIDLGVMERRGQNRINVPDIFRIAAKMKRKGGVAPRRKQ